MQRSLASLAPSRLLKKEGAMPIEDHDDNRTYLVVANDEEQYSIWPKDKQVPAGWRAVGKEGPKPDCLQHVEEVWTDMRPLSLRKRMEEDEGRER
jgi:MbtH protein